MSEQPEALWLADIIDSDFDPDWMAEEGYDQIAAELRRLHDEVERLRAECDESRAERDALVDATGSGLVLEAIQIIRSDKAEVERLREVLQEVCDRPMLAEGVDWWIRVRTALKETK